MCDCNADQNNFDLLDCLTFYLGFLGVSTLSKSKRGCDPVWQLDLYGFSTDIQLVIFSRFKLSVTNLIGLLECDECHLVGFASLLQTFFSVYCKFLKEQ